MKDSSDTDRRALKRLRDKAYMKELDGALATLASSFDDWREKRIDGQQLSDAIHKFHDGDARRLFSIYCQLDERMAVASAVARGILHRDEVPEHLLAQMQMPIDFFADDGGA